MSEILKKISNYNIFNYLLPGAIFNLLLPRVTYLNFSKITPDNIVIILFYYYFIGLAISRVGSLLIEPVVRKVIEFNNHNDFIAGSKNNDKINVLSEQNNMYRTFIALFTVLIFIKGYLYISDRYLFGPKVHIWVFLVSMFVLFVASYIKSISYIKKYISIYLTKK